MKTAYTLVGQDGNAFSLIGYAIEAMKDAYREARKREDGDGIKRFGYEAQKELQSQAFSSGYDNVICVCSAACADVNDYLGLEG